MGFQPQEYRRDKNPIRVIPLCYRRVIHLRRVNPSHVYIIHAKMFLPKSISLSFINP